MGLAGDAKAVPPLPFHSKLTLPLSLFIDQPTDLYIYPSLTCECVHMPVWVCVCMYACTACIFFFFFGMGNTERAQCALSRVCIP